MPLESGAAAGADGPSFGEGGGTRKKEGMREHGEVEKAI